MIYLRGKFALCEELFCTFLYLRGKFALREKLVVQFFEHIIDQSVSLFKYSYEKI